MSTKPQPTAAQVAALQLYANLHGRCWKQELGRAWETGNYAGFPGAHLLQQVRNSFGPSWLQRFTFPSPTAYRQQQALDLS